MYINFSEIAFQSLFQSFQLIWPLYTLLLIVVIGKLVLLFYKHYQFSTAGIFEIDHMSGDDFEKFLGGSFKGVYNKIDYLNELGVTHILINPIQKSPSYSSGYALRFPRILRERTNDKGLSDIDNMERINKIYKNQRGRI